MQKTNDMPWWVFLALANIERRVGALWLIGSCVLFTLYCVPWSLYLKEPVWIGKVFRIGDWSWFAMMVPICLWYWLSLKWVDKRDGWSQPVPALDK